MRSNVFSAVPVCILTFIRIALTAYCAEREINLQESLDFALKQNRELAMLSLSANSRGINQDRASAEFKLNIRPEATGELTGDSGYSSYGLNFIQKTPFGTEARIGGQTSSQSFSGTDNIHRNTVTIEIQQPLLRHLGRLVNSERMELANSAMKTARREIEIRKTDLIVEVVETYEGLLKLQRQIEYEQQTVERLNRFNRLTQAREKQGRTTRVDSLRSDLKLGNARLRLNSTSQQLQSLRSEFADLLGFPPATEFKTTAAPRLTVNAPDIEMAVKSAMQNRLDYAQILQDCEDAARGVKIARRFLLPDLKMISRYQIEGLGATASEAKLDEDTWFVGLSLASDFPLRNERFALSEAMLNDKTAQLRTETVKSAISRQVRQSILSYNRVQTEITFAEQNHKLAENRAKLARRLFEMGKGDSFSVSDAEDELAQAEMQLLSAQSEASTVAYKLKRVLGTLIEYPPELRAHPEIPLEP